MVASETLVCTIVRMKVVADTNIFLAVALDEPEKQNIVRLTANVSAVAPEILPYELGNALSVMLKRAQLSEAQAFAALEVAKAIPVRLVCVDIAAALRLAAAFGIYAYDAYFLECARTMASPLITLDTGMKRVADALGIETLE